MITQHLSKPTGWNMEHYSILLRQNGHHNIESQPVNDLSIQISSWAVIGPSEVSQIKFL